MNAPTLDTLEERAKWGGLIDHTLLKPLATSGDIDQWCDEAIEHRFFSVCVNSCFVPQVRRKLADTGVKTCTVIGFPLGASHTSAKAAEARLAVDEGAHELDMVLAIGHLKSGDHAYVERDIAAVVKAGSTALVKVILETCYLNEEEIKMACKLSVSAGAHFVKTSTGFGASGAKVADVALMRRIVGPNLGVKASGGIRDLVTAKAMITAGANRLGASSGVAILKDLADSGH